MVSPVYVARVVRQSQTARKWASNDVWRLVGYGGLQPLKLAYLADPLRWLEARDGISGAYSLVAASTRLRSCDT